MPVINAVLDMVFCSEDSYVELPYCAARATVRGMWLPITEVEFAAFMRRPGLHRRAGAPAGLVRRHRLEAKQFKADEQHCLRNRNQVALPQPAWFAEKAV